MASTDWDKPTIDDTHVEVLAELNARDVDAIKFIDDETPTNLPEKAKKWDDSLKVFRTYLSTVWTTLILGVAGGGTGSGTAAGARTNLSVDSSAEVTTKVAVHQAIANAHGAVSAATVNKIIVRDASGRAKVVAPSAEDDIALKSNVTTVNTALTTHGALANAHGAVSAPTVSKIILRDAAGRAQVEDPSADKDIANKQWVVATAASNPVGVILLFGGTISPDGFLFCNGDAINRTIYADLFAVIGTAYGIGNGSTTFNIPDLRQRFPLGKAAAGTGSTLGGTGGAIDHTHTGPSHNHKWYERNVVGVDDQSYDTNGNLIDINTVSEKEPTFSALKAVAEQGFPELDMFTNLAGTGATGTNNPPYQVVNYIIKF